MCGYSCESSWEKEPKEVIPLQIILLFPNLIQSLKINHSSLVYETEQPITVNIY